MTDCIENTPVSCSNAIGAQVQAAFREFRAGNIPLDALFEVIVPLLYPPLTAFLGGAYLFQPADQDEVIQEIMLKVLKPEMRQPSSDVGAVKYDSTRPFMPWIYVIARNEANRFLKSRSRHNELFKPNEETDVHGGPCTPRSECNSDVDDASHCHAILLRLPQQDRSLLWMKYAEELTEQEIANSLKQPCSAIKGRLRRAKARFRKLSELLSRSKPPDPPDDAPSSGTGSPAAPTTRRVSKTKERTSIAMSSDKDIYQLFRALRTREIARISPERQTYVVDCLKQYAATDATLPHPCEHTHSDSYKPTTKKEEPAQRATTKKPNKVLLISFLITALVIMARAFVWLWKPQVVQAAAASMLLTMSVGTVSISSDSQPASHTGSRQVIIVEVHRYALRSKMDIHQWIQAADRLGGHLLEYPTNINTSFVDRLSTAAPDRETLSAAALSVVGDFHRSPYSSIEVPAQGVLMAHDRRNDDFNQHLLTELAIERDHQFDEQDFVWISENRSVANLSLIMSSPDFSLNQPIILDSSDSGGSYYTLDGGADIQSSPEPASSMLLLTFLLALPLVARRRFCHKIMK